jgi:putative hemolysin
VVDASTKADELRELLRASGHPRVGVYSERPDNIVGVLNIYDVLLDQSGAPPSAHVRAAMMFPEHLGVIEALFELQRRREALSFVVSADGQCLGVASVKDLVEEIVGELEEW